MLGRVLVGATPCLHGPRDELCLSTQTVYGTGSPPQIPVIDEAERSGSTLEQHMRWPIRWRRAGRHPAREPVQLMHTTASTGGRGRGRGDDQDDHETGEPAHG